MLPVIAMFFPLGVAALIVAGALFLLADPDLRKKLAENRLPFYLLPFALLGLFGFISSLWSVDPLHSLDVALRLALFLLAVLLHQASVDSLDESERRRLVKLFALAGFLHLVLVGLAGGPQSPLGQLMQTLNPQNQDDGKSHFNRGVAALAVMGGSYLAIWLVWRGGRFALVGLALLLAALSQAMSISTPLALGGALMAGLLALRFKVAGGRLVYGAFLALLLSLPFLLARIYETDWMKDLLTQYMSWNVKHRLIIWQFAIERYFEHPILGWGLDSSRQLPGGSVSIPNVEGAEFMPLHPHNGFLQVWLELGPLGVLLLAWQIVALARRQAYLYANRPLWLGLATAVTTAYLMHGLLSYGIWQNWWTALALLAATSFKVAAVSMEKAQEAQAGAFKKRDSPSP